MKRIIALLLALLMAFSLIACNSGTKPDASEPSDSSKPADPATAPADADKPAADGDKAAEGSVNFDDPIYIGVLDAFTGDKASNGEYSKEGADLAMKHINENGGVMGRAIEIVYEDDQGNETAATNAFQKIVSQYDLAAVCLNKFSSVVLAMEQFVAEEGLPAICCGSSVRLEGSETSNLYSTRKSDSGSGVTIANYCKELGMTKVAILHAPDALGTGMTPVIKARFQELGIETVSVQQFSADEKNFAPYLAKIIDSGCDGIIGIAQQAEAALIMIAVEEAGLDVPCIGNSAFAQQVAIENSAGACDQWYSVSAFSPTAENEPTKSWIAEYAALYGRKPDMTSACMYDAVTLFCQAMEATQSTDWEVINEYLHNIKDVQGIASVYTYNGTPMLSTSEFIVQIQESTASVVATVKG